MFMRVAVAEQKFAISCVPARHIIGPLGEGADPAHAREDVHILFGGLELVERAGRGAVEIEPEEVGGSEHADRIIGIDRTSDACELIRSEEHTSELQSLMRISYAVLCLKKKTRDKK